MWLAFGAGYEFKMHVALICTWSTFQLDQLGLLLVIGHKIGNMNYSMEAHISRIVSETYL